MEPPRDRRPAVAAAIAVHPVAPDRVPVAHDERRAAAGAPRRLPVGVVDVADVDEAEAAGERDGAGADEGHGGRAHPVEHLEVGVEGREVERHVGAQVLEDPVALASDLVVAVVQARDQQRRDLGPHRGLAPEPYERVEHGLEMPEGDAVVELLREPLQVHVGRVHVLEDLGARLGGHVAGGHEPVDRAGRARRARDVDRELGPDDRVVVGVGDPLAAGAERQLDDLRRRGGLARVLVDLRLADVPVLAELAAEVAARRPEGEDARAGKEVVERLLLDGIDGEAGRAPVARAPQLSAPILADVAETRLSLADETVARAERAEELAALPGVPPARGVEVHGPRVAGRPRSAARGSEVRRTHGITARLVWGEDGDQQLRIARSTSYGWMPLTGR